VLCRIVIRGSGLYKGNKQVLVTGTAVLDDDGNIALVVTNVRDMTLLNDLRAQLEESRRLSSRYYQSLWEQDGFEHVLIKYGEFSGALTHRRR
jgi:hypothetical protein